MGHRRSRCADQVGVGVGLGLARELGLGLRGRRSKGRCTFARRRWCRGAVREGVQLGRASGCLPKGTRRMSCTEQAARGRAAGAGLGVRGRRAAAGGCRRTARAASRRRGSRRERCARERLATRERGPAVWAGGGVSGDERAALVRLGQRWRGGRTCSQRMVRCAPIQLAHCSAAVAQRRAHSSHRRPRSERWTLARTGCSLTGSAGALGVGNACRVVQTATPSA